MPHLDTDSAHIAQVTSWNSGGDVELDIVELDDGMTLVVGEDSIVVYRSAADFWAEANGEAGAPRSVTTLLRPTGEVMRLG